MKVSTINRFFNIAFGALAMVATALFSAYLAMRIAIHGREVKVPTLSGLPLSEAAKKANNLGLRLNVENRFYSANTAPGAILSQSPQPGEVVRRQWTVRVTESLGPQQVSIPNLVGQSERPATIAIRRLGLELGTIAHIPSPGPADIVLAQTPTPTSNGADSPRISLLLSALEPPPPSRPKASLDAIADAASINPATGIDTGTDTGIEMPSLAGLTLSAALARASSLNLHIVSVEDLSTPTTAPAAAPTPPATAALSITPRTVVAQFPPAGHRVQPGDPVKITLGH